MSEEEEEEEVNMMIQNFTKKELAHMVYEFQILNTRLGRQLVEMGQSFVLKGIDPNTL